MKQVTPAAGSVPMKQVTPGAGSVPIKQLTPGAGSVQQHCSCAAGQMVAAVASFAVCKADAVRALLSGATAEFN